MAHEEEERETPGSEFVNDIPRRLDQHADPESESRQDGAAALQREQCCNQGQGDRHFQMGRSGE